MKYIILILFPLILAACQVNLNLFPKFEGKKWDKKAKVDPAAFKAASEGATAAYKATQDQPHTIEWMTAGTIGQAVAGGPVTLTPAKHCPHHIVLAVKNKAGTLCTCQECWEVFPCKVTQ